MQCNKHTHCGDVCKHTVQCGRITADSVSCLGVFEMNFYGKLLTMSASDANQERINIMTDINCSTADARQTP